MVKRVAIITKGYVENIILVEDDVNDFTPWTKANRTAVVATAHEINDLITAGLPVKPPQANLGNGNGPPN